MVKSKIYNFSTTRNKNEERNWGVKAIKGKLSLIYGCKCNECSEEITLGKLYLDHIIPVSISGPVFDINNLQLLCRKCHRDKTTIDVRIINTLKKLKILEKDNLFLNPKTVHKLYWDLFKLASIANDAYHNWYKFNPDQIKDYEQIMYKDNRMVKREVKEDGESRSKI